MSCADAIVMKPLHPEEIDKTIQRLLNNGSQENLVKP